MERDPTTLSIDDVRSTFVEIEFPEYQREPDIWSRDQKQRLIDSILRRFDIASVYFYRREDQGLECIDGRQRLNAIMSFFAENPSDENDNGFPLKLENEISGGLETEFDTLGGLKFVELQSHADDTSSNRHEAASRAINAIREYRITTIMLSGVANEAEFNLQFLRLNLGTLINSGEKLNAMVGAMRDVVFSETLGKHPFFDFVRIPTRRYAKELTAAQVLLQVFWFRDSNGEFARARHTDLQRFLKANAEIQPHDPRIEEVASTLDALRDGAEVAAGYLRNRAVTVSLVLVAWQRNVRTGAVAEADALAAATFWEFAELFLKRLHWVVEKMKSFEVYPEYPHLVEFQRHLTQASVEKPAVTRRHQILQTNLDRWLVDGRLIGDAEYQDRTGIPPGP